MLRVAAVACSGKSKATRYPGRRETDGITNKKKIKQKGKRYETPF